jgi:hypothetical protein
MTKPITLIEGDAQRLYDEVTRALHSQWWERPHDSTGDRVVHVGVDGRRSWLVALAPEFIGAFRSLPYRWIEDHWELGEVDRPKSAEIRSLLKRFQVSHDCAPEGDRMREEFHRTAVDLGLQAHPSMWGEDLK